MKYSAILSSFFLVFIFSISGTYCILAGSHFQYAVSAGGSDWDQGFDISSDIYGNKYIAGSFRYSAQFGDISLVSNGYGDIFIARMDAGGNFLWARNAGGSSWDRASGIFTDASGNSYITGDFMGTAYFGTIELFGYDNTDIFVAKLDAEGNFLWAVRAGGNGYDRAFAISADSLGNTYITGYFEDTAGFGSHTISSAGITDVFVAKLDNAGNFLWAKRAGGLLEASGRGIDLSVEEDLYITGQFRGTAYFGEHEITSSGDQDVFVAKMDANGNFLWSMHAGGPDRDESYGISADNAGGINVTGIFSDIADFGDTNLICQGERDIFITRLDTSGNFIWARRAGGMGIDYGLAVDCDYYGSIYITGSFEGTAGFGEYNLVSHGMTDLFLARLNQQGEFQWACSAGGTLREEGSGIYARGFREILLTGYYEGNAQFGDTGLSSAGQPDIFIAGAKDYTAVILGFEDPSYEGIWKWSFTEGGYSGWDSMLEGFVPDKILTGDVTGDGIINIVANIPGYGMIYHSFVTGVWYYLTSECIDFDIIKTSHSGPLTILASFPEAGVFYYDFSASLWTEIIDIPALIVRGADLNGDTSGISEGIFTFSMVDGLYVYDGETGVFTRIINISPSHVIAGDVNGDGRDDLVCSFDGYGLYIVRNTSKTDLNGESSESWLKEGSTATFNPGTKGWVFTRIAYAVPDTGHNMAMGDITGTSGLEIFLTYLGRTYFYSYDSMAWSSLLMAPLKRIASGRFTGGEKDDLSACVSSSGSIYLYKSDVSAWSLMINGMDTSAISSY